MTLTLREKIKGILTCKTLDALRKLSIEDEDENVRKYKDELGFLKHALFLFHAKQLKRTGTIPSQYLSEIIWQYLSHSTNNPHEDQTVIDRIQERRKVFAEALKSQLEVLNRSLNSGIIPAYYLYYWTELDETRNSNFSTERPIESGFSIKSVVQYINELEPPTKNIIVFPHKGSDVNAESYDEYVANLNSSLYERSEYYDLIMLDSIQVSQYSSRGGIHTFQNLLMNYSSEYKNRILSSNAKIFDVVRSENGLIEALPVTRNFHLPARGQTFDDFEGPSISDFFKDGRLEHLLVEQVLIENSSIKDQKRIDINNFYKKYTSVKYFSEFTSENLKEFTSKNPTELIQFALDMDNESFFIPMQLARGNHATYTLMAYTANIRSNENFVLALLRRQPTDQIDRIAALQERLEKIFSLIFLYVPTGALCLDHLRASNLREKYPDYWFDPCLPIEAVGFHGSDFQIKVRRKPATLRNLPLSCLGGFCLGVTRSSRDASGAAQAAIDIAERLVAIENENPQRISQSSESLWDLSKRDWLVHEININDISNLSHIATPEQAACRPNINLWPLLEAKISFTFRLYVAALFAFRAIHFECIPLLDMDFEGMHRSDFSTIYALRDIHQTKFEDYRRLGFEIFYLNKLTPSLIENYFKNMRDFLVASFLVKSSNSEETQVESSNRKETKEFIELNLNDIIGDADYICGILQACAEYAEDTYAKNPGRYDIKKENDESAKARALYLRASLFMRSMAASMSKTIVKEIIS